MIETLYNALNMPPIMAVHALTRHTASNPHATLTRRGERVFLRRSQKALPNSLKCAPCSKDLAYTRLLNIIKHVPQHKMRALSCPNPSKINPYTRKQ